MSAKKDWENINIGCMFCEINNAIGELQKVIEDDKELSERYFTREEYVKVVEVLRLLDVKRSLVMSRIHKIYHEANEVSEETQDSLDGEEYRIEEDDKDDGYVGVICLRRKDA